MRIGDLFRFATKPKMRASYSDRYVIKLPENHRFPIKYARIRERLVTEGTLRTAEVTEPALAERDAILLVQLRRIITTDWRAGN